MGSNPDRAGRVSLLIAAFRIEHGPAAVPLMVALGRRALLAAQTPGAVAALAPHLADSSPAVREQAALTLHALLDADYLDQPPLRRDAIAALAASLARAGASFAPRVAALEALGAAGPRVLENPAARALFNLGGLVDPGPPPTFAEEGARLHALGELNLPGRPGQPGQPNQQGPVMALLKQLPLDAPADVEAGAEWAAARLAPKDGVQEIMQRMKRKYDAGLRVANEIRLLGDLPRAQAVPALLEAWKLGLGPEERWEFVGACDKLADPSLEGPLAATLGASREVGRAGGAEIRRMPGFQMRSFQMPSFQTDVLWNAAEALMKIDTEDAARALESRLASEGDLLRKLRLAEFLGRHGRRDGYPYAIEHMSEPYLRDQAIAALAAMRDPRAPKELRKILAGSNDPGWNAAAVRALGRLGAVDVAPRFLEMARDARNPLAPSAVAALGDLGGAAGLDVARAGLEIVHAGFASRHTEMLVASARAAGELAAVPGLRGGASSGQGGSDRRAAVSGRHGTGSGQVGAGSDQVGAVLDQLGALLADPGAPEEARAAALDSLVALDDRRLDPALERAVRDAGLEGTDLIAQIEKLMRQRKLQVILR